MKLKIITSNITCKTHWKKGTTYIVTNAITVTNTGKLTIDDGVQVALLNGNTTFGGITFAQGSRLKAGKIYSYAVGSNYVKAYTANNGGWTFNGTAVAVGGAVFLRDSKFKLESLVGDYLGNGDATTPVPAITLNGLKCDEFKVCGLVLSNGTDADYTAISANNVDIKLAVLVINISNSTSTGLSVSNSSIDVSKKFSLLNPETAFSLTSSTLSISYGAKFVINATNDLTGLTVNTADPRVPAVTSAPYTANIKCLRSKTIYFD